MTKKTTLKQLQADLEALAKLADDQAEYYSKLTPAKLSGDDAFALATENKDFFSTLEELTEALYDLSQKAEDLAFSAEMAFASAG